MPITFIGPPTEAVLHNIGEAAQNSLKCMGLKSEGVVVIARILAWFQLLAKSSINAYYNNNKVLCIRFSACKYQLK